MKAVVVERYGSSDVLEVRDIATPAPGAGEVLVEIHAASVNSADHRMMRADPFLVRLDNGLRRPKHPVLGMDFAGTVVAVGPGVTRFQVGDAVVGDVSNFGMGAYAEYVAAPEAAVARKPAGLPFAQAAALPLAGVTAWQGLQMAGGVRAGQHVLVNGASGGVGAYAVQIAKALGAEVTGTCSASKVDFVRSLGADHVVDYRQADVTQSDAQFDIILDIGAFRAAGDYRPVLKAGGIYVLVGGAISRLLRLLALKPLLQRTTGMRLAVLSAKFNPADMDALTVLVEAGQVVAYIDRRFSLAEAPEAMRYFESGAVRGNAVIEVRAATG
jgi:NADPH:quinone reductase-like Zn-dependent oxidoreductase